MFVGEHASDGIVDNDTADAAGNTSWILCKAAIYISVLWGVEMLQTTESEEPIRRFFGRSESEEVTCLAMPHQ